MLTKALGDERANHPDRPRAAGSDTAGIESLKWMDAATAADLKNEHPQIIATILVHLEFDQAGEILKHFTDRPRATTCASLRIATLDGVQPVGLRELNEFTRMLAGATVKKTAMGGVATRRTSSTVGSAAETAILDNVREYDLTRPEDPSTRCSSSRTS